MPLDHPAPDLIADLHALIEASAKLDRIAVQRGLTTRDLRNARAEARHALFRASHMNPDLLAARLDSTLQTRPEPVRRARIAKASTSALRPDTWTPDLTATRARLRESVCNVLARIEGKQRPTT